jgi:hypothetical protein
MTTPATAEELRAAQEAEYGTYVATQHIYVNGALAFNPGDAVPVSHVKREVVDKSQVEKVTVNTDKKG